ncbi:MAG: L-threonine 3-dehydrogenase [Chthonomonadales bacterium]
MKAIVKKDATPGAALVQIPEPRVRRPDDVLVRVLMTSICGTDAHIYEWDAWAAQRVKPPRVMGHEFVGRVEEVGPEVQGVRPGDLVSGESHLVCGICYQCRNGQKHVCSNTRILGVDIDGCFAEYVVVPSASVWVNDPGLPLEIACIQDPLGNAVHATLAGEIVGRTVAVLGCGPIGIFAVAVAQAAGAACVYAVDVRPYRLDLARRLGATDVCDASKENCEEFINRKTDGLGVDVALEMSGAPVAIAQAMRITRRGGRVSLMGIPSRHVELDVAEDMIFKGLEVRCIVGRRLYETWTVMKHMLASGKLVIAPAITHKLCFDEYDRAMALMRDGSCGKVVFEL